MQLSERVNSIKPSATLAVAAKATELKSKGVDVIDLGLGEPDFDTPNHIKQAAIVAIEAGFTKYTAVDGTATLKKAIINKFKNENNLHYDASQVAVSVGAKQCIFNLALALLNPGDEVIIPAPYWVSYPDIALLAGAKPVIITTGIEQHFKITPEQLKQAITPNTRLFIINSPSNPSGIAYSKHELEALGKVLEQHPNIVILSDDIYEHILWTEAPFTNIVNACPALFDRTVVVNGASKVFAMTGWRIGYSAGPAALIGAMKKIQSQSTSNPASMCQVAVEAGLNGSQDFVRKMKNAFQERHAVFYTALSQLPGVKCLPSDGTFYTFPDFSAAIERLGFKDDLQLADFLLQEAHIAAVPGSAFGAKGCLRFSYAVGMDVINQAITRLQKVFK